MVQIGPNESGYYWFYYNTAMEDKVRIVYYQHINQTVLLFGHIAYIDLITLLNEGGYFIQPVKPIPKPCK